MATQTTGGGSTTSFTKTPQANSDSYDYIEDTLYNDSTLYDRLSKTVYLDVMSNDLGGNAKTLFSVDDGGTGALTDLLKLETAWEQTADKNWIRVYGGKIEFKIGDGSNDVANARDVNSLDTDDSVDDTFVYAIRMGNGTLAWATVHITITGENDGPITGGDTTASGSEDDSSIGGNVPAATDVDGDPLTYHLVAGSVEIDGAAAPDGTVIVNADGSYSYDPSGDQDLDDGETRTITFRYVANDGDADSDEATVTITVTGADDAPTLSDPTDGSIAEVDQSSTTTPLGLSGTLDGDDVDGDTLTYGIDGGTVSGDGLTVSYVGSYGTLTVTIATGAYVYTPDAAAIEALDDGETPDDTFTVTVSDGDGPAVSQTYVVNLTGADDAPTSSNGSGSTDEDTPLNDSLPAATDVDGDSVTYALGTDAAHGDVVVNADGTFTYTPDENYHGTDSFTFTISDGDDGPVTYTYDLTVNSVNDPPELTGTQATLAAGTEDVAYTVSKADLIAGFSDVDGDLLGVANITADHGDVVLNMDGSYTVTPADDYNGTVTLSYEVVDGHGGSVAATLSFSLAAVNDPAVIGGDASGEVTEAGTSSPGDPDDTGTLTISDPDAGEESFKPASGTTTYGSFTVNAAGVWTYVVDNTNAVVNALVAGAFLMDSFVVEAADGTTKTVDIKINGADDGVAAPATYNGLDAVNDHDSDLGVGTSSSPLITGTGDGETINGRTGTGQTADTINALGGDDTVNAGDGGDTVYGGEGSDTIHGGAGNDALYGQGGIDFLYGEGNNDQLFGGSGNDTLDGGDNTDMLLNGGSGNDTIIGGPGADIIIGGFGADTLTGGDGNDNFVYSDVRDTNDTILDFMAGDEINLSGIDADPLAALNQSFAWGGTTPTAHGAWYAEVGGNTVLYADTDGNTATAEFMVTLQGFSAWGTLFDTTAEGPPTGVTL
jgi:VCBS repeat-containing protein